MNEEEIIQGLKAGRKFTGCNGAFAGIVIPLAYNDKSILLPVVCEKDGREFYDYWILTHTSNPQLSSSASFLRLNVLSSLN